MENTHHDGCGAEDSTSTTASTSNRLGLFINPNSSFEESMENFVSASLLPLAPRSDPNLQPQQQQQQSPDSGTLRVSTLAEFSPAPSPFNRLLLAQGHIPRHGDALTTNGAAIVSGGQVQGEQHNHHDHHQFQQQHVAGGNVDFQPTTSSSHSNELLDDEGDEEDDDLVVRVAKGPGHGNANQQNCVTQNSLN